MSYKVSAYSAGELGSIPRSGGSPGEGNGNRLQYSCLENSMDRGAWWATVHGTSCGFDLPKFQIIYKMDKIEAPT